MTPEKVTGEKRMGQAETIVVDCECGKRWHVPVENAGRRAKCGACRAALLIPSLPLTSRHCADCGRERDASELEEVDTTAGYVTVCESCLAGKGRRAISVVPLIASCVLFFFAAYMTMGTDDSRNGKLAREGLFPMVAGVGVFFYLRWRRRLAISARQALQDDDRRPILYLRSFRDEAWERRMRLMQALMPNGSIMDTAEERLGTAMNRLGPFVAVGTPGESLPAMGAARIYLDDDVWQREVARLMDASVLIVLRVAGTEGLAWELEEVVRRVDPRRLLLWVTCTGRSYKRFREWAGDVLPKGLPAKKSAYIAFGKDWKPQPIRFRPSFSFDSSMPILRNLSSVLTRLKLVARKREPSLAWLVPIGASMAGVFFALLTQ